MIRLLVSDVDGTLLTPDKRLTAATVTAVGRLRSAGIDFTIVSARPPFGMRLIVQELNINLPYGAYNGSLVTGMDGSISSTALMPAQTARRAIDLLTERGVDVWVFTPTEWIIRNVDGPYVEHECKTIAHVPTMAASFDAAIDSICKIVGVSTDPDVLIDCEQRLNGDIGSYAMIARSQSYYLDVTSAGIDKGTFVQTLTRRLGLDPENVAVIGDMPNDVPMFKAARHSIAMGNAASDVQSKATRVTLSNADNGFSHAIDELMIGYAGPRQ